MKIIALGDTHGSTTWKDIVKKHPEVDKVVFIGDYVDSHDPAIKGEQQANNLKDIIQFKKSNPNKVVLLVGNHDYSYWDDGEQCGGFQPRMKEEFNSLFMENKELFQMVYIDDRERVYCHAGITKVWLNYKKVEVEDINKLWGDNPKAFSFYPLDQGGVGDCVYQSPIWVRPFSLQSNPIDKLMIVGHTRVGKINNGRGFYMIDVLHKNKEYLYLEDDRIEIKGL